MTRMVLITDKKISVIQDLLPLLEQIVKTGRKLLNHCGRYRRRSPVYLDCQTACAVPLPVFAVKAPGFGDRRKEMLQDIAILTGGNRHFGRSRLGTERC